MYGRRFWSCDQHEVENTMPMFSQGIVTPVRENDRKRDREGGDDLFNKGALHDVESSFFPTTDNSGLTRHSTKMAQNGSRVIGKDSEVPSMPTEYMIAAF